MLIGSARVTMKLWRDGYGTSDRLLRLPRRHCSPSPAAAAGKTATGTSTVVTPKRKTGGNAGHARQWTMQEAKERDPATHASAST